MPSFFVFDTLIADTGVRLSDAPLMTCGSRLALHLSITISCRHSNVRKITITANT